MKIQEKVKIKTNKIQDSKIIKDNLNIAKIYGTHNLKNLKYQSINSNILNKHYNINKDLNTQIYKKKNISYQKPKINQMNFSQYSTLNQKIPFHRKTLNTSLQINYFSNNNYNIINNTKNYETEKKKEFYLKEEEKNNILNEEDLKYIGFFKEKNFMNEQNQKFNIINIKVQSVINNRESYNFIKEKKLKFLENIFYKDLKNIKLRKYKSCVICNNYFKDNDLINIFYCGEHIFHTICLKNWLFQSSVCPFCNYDFMKY